MAVIYLSHPVHGRKVATMDLEADADEKNGWSRCDEAVPVIEDTAPVNVMEVKRKSTRKESEQ